MTESLEKKSGIGKFVVIVAAVVVMALGAGLLLIASLGAALGNDSAPESDNPACTPGDADNAGLSIPEEYLEPVNAAAAESGFSPSAIAAQIQHESGWKPDAVSGAGAKGIAQFMDGTWKQFGNGGDVFNPEDSISALGRYMAYLANFMKDHATDEAHLLRLSLAGYNAGQGAVQKNGFDLESLYASDPGYMNETKPYVENIVAASNGEYTSDCQHSSSVPEGSIVETSMALAWEEKVSLPFSGAYAYGREASRPEYVSEANKLSSDYHTAYYTDCGVFVATTMISSGADKNFPHRGTSVMISYLSNSEKYDYFLPKSEGDLEPGDILITPGHIFLYTGERNTTATGRAQGASLYTRPPSGHDFYLSDTSGRTYYAARLKG